MKKKLKKIALITTVAALALAGTAAAVVAYLPADCVLFR